nr:MAG TPA: hypothetical protein [Caudoviricetes sp.]
MCPKRTRNLFESILRCSRDYPMTRKLLFIFL